MITYICLTIACYKKISHVNSRGIKLKLTNENFASLWHMQLDHISQKGIEKLMLEIIFYLIDFLDLSVCVNLIKGKNIRLGINKTSNVLELTYTNICGLFLSASWNVNGHLLCL